MLDENGSPLLEDIITYICTKKRPAQRLTPEVDPDTIILEDYPNELFPDTYSRLFIKKVK